MRNLISWLTQSSQPDDLSAISDREERELQESTFLKQKVLEGLKLEKQNSFTQAITCYRDVLNKDFSCYEAHEAMVSVLTKQGNFQEAKFHFDKAVSLKNNQNESSNSGLKSETLIKNQNTSNLQAIKPQKQYTEEILGSNRTNVAFLSPKSGLHEKKATESSQLDKLDDKKFVKLPDSEYLLTKKYLQDRYKKVGKILLEQALLFYEDKEWDKAISTCQKVLKKSTCLAEAHKIWGNCLQYQGKPSEAIEQYAKALEINPDFVEIYVNMGNILAKRSKWNQALNYYTQALNINPRCAAAHRNLARLWEQLNDLDKAEEHLFQAISLEPEIFSAEQHLQLAEDLIQEDKKTQAIACCRHAISLKPNLQEAYMKLIDILETSDRWRETSQYYRQLLKLKDEVIRGEIGTSNRVRQLLSSGTKKSLPNYQKINAELVSNQIQASELLQLPPAHRTVNRSISNQTNNSQKISSQADSIDAKLQIGGKYELKQQWKEAIYCYKQAIKQKPDCAIAYSKLAHVYRKSGNLKAFATCFYRASVLQPKSVSVQDHFSLGNLLVSQNKILEAAVSFRKVLELDPTFIKAKEKLEEITSVYQQQSAVAEMSKQETKIESIQASLVSNSERPKIKPEFSQSFLQSLIPKETVDSQKSSNLDNNEQLAEVIVHKSIASQSLSNVNSNIISQSQNYYDLAIDAEKEKDWQQAAIFYQRAIEIDPQDWKSSFSLGEVLYKQKLWQDAISAYSQSIKINSEYFWAHHNLGEALLELKQWKKSGESFRKAIELNPGFSWSHYKLGSVLMQSNQMTEAASRFRTSIKLKADFDWVHHKLGDVLVALEDWDGAISAYRQALVITPDLPQTAEKLNDVLRTRAEIERNQVREYYQAAIIEEPGRESLYYKALEVNTQDIQSYISLAKINEAKDQRDMAIAFYKIALQIQPDNSEVITALEKLKS